MTFSHDTYRYLIGRAMPEGLQFDAQQQWLMNFIDSLERTIIQQSAHRRMSEKQVRKVQALADTMSRSGCADRCKAGSQILEAIESVAQGRS